MRELTAEERKEFVVNRQGRDFILYKGLIHLAHEAGLTQIDTDIVAFPTKENHETTFVKAVVTFQDSEGRETTFPGHGDANPDNVGRMIAQHCPRMAETRAIARAMRLALDVGYTAFEELSGDEEEEKNKRTSRRQLEEPEEEERPARREKTARREESAEPEEAPADPSAPASAYTMKRIKKNLQTMGREDEFDKLPTMTERQAGTYLAMLQNERSQKTS